jgi:hypothetical protein
VLSASVTFNKCSSTLKKNSTWLAALTILKRSLDPFWTENSGSAVLWQVWLVAEQSKRPRPFIRPLCGDGEAVVP